MAILAITLSCPFVASAGRLNTAEEAHLIFMRSEEKLARDVYLTLAQEYQNPVFETIATQSEQIHTDTMLEMIVKFKLDDPEPNADDLPNSIGVFENPYFDSYFNEKWLIRIMSTSECAGDRDAV